MSVPGDTITATATGTLAASGLPPRVRKVLDATLARAQAALADPVRSTCVALEGDLFARAERARSNEAQAELMVNLQAVRQHAGAVLPRMLVQLESELAAIRTPRAPLQAPVAMPATLTLVEDAEMDQEIVLRELVRRQESRLQVPLHLLGQRFGVLAGAPALDEAVVPLGPQSLCRALRAAAPLLQVDLATRLQFYRLFEQKVLADYAELLNAIGQTMEREGVLPGLVYAPRHSRSERTAARPRPAPGKQDPAKPRGESAAPEGDGNRPLTGWMGQSRARSWASPAAMLGSLARGLTGRAAAEDDAPTFGMLQKMLAARNAAAAAAGEMAEGQVPSWVQGGTAPGAGPPGGGTAAAAAAGPRGGAAPSAPDGAGTGAAAGQPGTASAGTAPAGAAGQAGALPAGTAMAALATGQVIGALQALQSQVSGGLDTGGAPLSLAGVREHLLQQLRQQHGPQAGLASEDEDTFELLDLLYHEIGREVRTTAPATTLLGRLQVPVVQAALADRAFFVRPQHPARELLNAVAESGATWLGEDEVDPVLLQKLQQAVDKVLSDYHGEERVFEEANQDVQEHFQVMARRAEVTERRHVEAARGKDRLEQAKARAIQTIGTALDGRQPPPFVSALLNQAWADVLTLTQLRSGEESQEWDTVAGLTRDIAEHVASPDAAADQDLAPRIGQALTAVGYHGDEAQVIARRLAGEAQIEDKPESREVAARLEARARVQPEAPKKPQLAPRTPAEQQCFEQIRLLPFGSWFEFTSNQQGDVLRQRLSWFNPMTGNALFVNQRGHKVGEHTLDSLARLMARGQARVVTEDRGRLIDRAWNATLNALRNLTGVPA